MTTAGGFLEQLMDRLKAAGMSTSKAKAAAEAAYRRYDMRLCRRCGRRLEVDTSLLCDPCVVDVKNGQT